MEREKKRYLPIDEEQHAIDTEMGAYNAKADADADGAEKKESASTTDAYPLNVRTGGFGEDDPQKSGFEKGLLDSEQKKSSQTPKTSQIKSDNDPSEVTLHEDGDTPNMDSLLQSYNARQKEAKKREKAAEASAAISGIADMGRAIANLYYVDKGSPNAYEPSMSTEAKRRLAEAQARRDELDKEWLSYVLDMRKAKTARDTYDLKKAELERKLKKDEEDNKRKDAINESKVKATEALEEYRRAIKAKNDQQAKYYEEKAYVENRKAELMESGQSAENAEKIAKADYYRAKAQKEGGVKTTTYERDRYGNVTQKSESVTQGKSQQAESDKPSADKPKKKKY